MEPIRHTIGGKPMNKSIIEEVLLGETLPNQVLTASTQRTTTPDLNELTILIREWAYDRGLDKVEPEKQIVKLMEEVGELASGFSKHNRDTIYDSIGDSFVVLTILAMIYKIDIETCVQYAYDEIKNRKGRTINGIFVKEEDL